MPRARHLTSQDGAGRPVAPIRAGQVLGVAFVTLMAILAFIPLYWMVITALQQPTLVVQFPPEWIPSDPTLRNFQEFLSRPYVGRWTLNSLLVAVSVTAVSLLLSAMAGYTFAKKQFIGRNFLFWLYVGSMMVPGQVTLIPLFLLMAKLGFQNTYYGLILPALPAPFGVFLLKQYIQTLPSELIDAARIDGCGEFGIFTRIILPLSKPGLSVLGIFLFVEQWNDFLWPLVITNEAAMRTLQVGLALVQEEVPLAFSLLMAGATYAAIPMVIIFFLFSRYFLKGMTVGAVKG